MASAQPPSPSSLESTPVRLVAAPVLGWVTWLAGLTVATHLCQLFGASFRTLAMAAVAWAPLAAALTWRNTRPTAHSTPADRSAAVAALLLCIVGSALALVIHRPDADDYNYGPAAVYHLEHPQDPMDTRVPYIYVEGDPIRSPVGATSQAFEYACACAAYLTGLSFLTVYHVATPAVFGFAIVAATLAAVSTFSGRARHAVAGTASLVAFATVLAETHRTFGNFSFGRAFQGKVLLMAVVIPLIVAWSRAYLDRPSWQRWTCLFALATAAVGATSSAVILVPLLFALLALSHVAARWESPVPLRRLASYAVACAYVVAFAGVGLFTWAGELGTDSVIHLGLPRTFLGHAAMMWGWPPLSPVLFVLATAAVAKTAPAATRRFLFAWIVGAALLLNPWVAPWLIEYVTTPNVYWRLFYLLPFPLVVGLAVTCALDASLDRPARRRAIIVGAVVSPLLLHPLLPGASVFHHRNDARVSWPEPKLDRALLAEARAVAVAAPPGLMLAPRDIAGILGLLTSAHPQLSVCGDQERLWVGSREGMAAARARIEASAFVGGLDREIQPFRHVLARYPEIVSVVLQAPASHDTRARHALTTAGFEERALTREVTLWVRPPRRAALVRRRPPRQSTWASRTIPRAH